MKKTFLIAVAAGLIGLGTAASAATFNIIGGSFDSIPGGAEGDESGTPKNEVLDGLGIGTWNPILERYELGGYSDGVSVSMGRSARVRVEVLGWEAGRYNSFTLDGTTVGKGLRGLSTSTTVVGDPLDSFTTSLISSLDFLFESRSSGGDLKGDVANGDSNTIPGLNFFASCGPGKEASRGCSTMYLAFDDSAVENDNHDDLVIRISAVPLPAGALLLLTGLGGMAAVRRRKAA